MELSPLGHPCVLCNSKAEAISLVKLRNCDSASIIHMSNARNDNKSNIHFWTRSSIYSSSSDRGASSSSYARAVSLRTFQIAASASTTALSSQSAPRQRHSLPAALCHVADDLINKFLERRPLEPSVDPAQVLAGNFAPVEELPPTECTEIEGTIPKCLDGVYIRNGPNPQHVPRGAYHLFDGDGMLHALTVGHAGDRGGYSVSLCCRYVRTSKFLQEAAAGASLIPNAFAGMAGTAGIARGAVAATRAALGVLDPTRGIGTANTNVVYFNGRVMALCESDAPYVIRVSRDGDLRTVGRFDFSGRLPFGMGMTAHPKVDPRTGELVAFSYGPAPPYLQMFTVSADGRRFRRLDVGSIPRPSLVHDFAITKNYALFPDTQLVMDAAEMLFGRHPHHQQQQSFFSYDANKVPRIGVVARRSGDVKWIEVPGFNFIHALNAWESGDDNDEVVLVAVNPQPLNEALSMQATVRPAVEILCINVRRGVLVKRQRISGGSQVQHEMGVINQRFVGRANRFAYMARGAPFPKIAGIDKIDLRLGRVVASRSFGAGVYGSEPFFVPQYECEEEDAGYVVCYVHEEEALNVSKFLVMDARSPSLRVVATVRLPSRVPYGFHGLFIPRKLLHLQRF